jgi:hypothetical protein
MFAMRIVKLFAPLLFFLAGPAPASTLTINETQRLGYATMAVPSGTSTITVNTMGNASGTGNIIYGSTFNGTYSILSTGGSPPPTIEIDIANVTNGTGYSLSDFRGEYDGVTISSFPATGLATPNGVAKILRIGATVTYNSSVSVGQQSPSFDIVVNYE